MNLKELFKTLLPALAIFILEAALAWLETLNESAAARELIQSPPRKTPSKRSTKTTGK